MKEGTHVGQIKAEQGQVSVDSSASLLSCVEIMLQSELATFQWINDASFSSPFRRSMKRQRFDGSGPWTSQRYALLTVLQLRCNTHPNLRLPLFC